MSRLVSMNNPLPKLFAEATELSNGCDVLINHFMIVINRICATGMRCSSFFYNGVCVIEEGARNQQYGKYNEI